MFLRMLESHPFIFSFTGAEIKFLISLLPCGLECLFAQRVCLFFLL